MGFGKHARGQECKTCCCARPQKCEEEGCDGFVHRDVVDEIEYGEDDWAWIHNFRCDKCDYKEYPEKDAPVEFIDEN